MEQASLDVAKQAYASPLLRRWELTHGFRAGGAPGSMAQDYRFQKKPSKKRRFLFRARHCRGDRSSICLRGDATADTSEFRALVRCSDNAPAYFRCFAVVRRPGDRTNDRTPRHHYPARPRPPKKCRPAKGKRPSRCATMLRIGNRPPGARRSRALRPLIKA